MPFVQCKDCLEWQEGRCLRNINKGGCYSAETAERCMRAAEPVCKSVVGIMNLQKKKRVRLQGKAIKQLNEQIHERDDYKCVFPGCGKYVPIGEKWHHEPCGSYKEDVVEKGCLLCQEHHTMRDSKKILVVKKACEDYLRGLYPEVWE